MRQRPGDVVQILIVDDEKVMQESCSRILLKEGYQVCAVNSGEEAIEQFSRESFDLVLLDLKMPSMGGIETLHRLKGMEPGLMVLIMTGYPSIETAVRAIKLGAYDYLTKPFTTDALRIAINRALERKSLVIENQHLRRQLRAKNEADIIIGQSEAMKNVYELVRRIAPTESTVLITGESGTGKELIAKAIHNHSLRENKEFVTVDCPALVEPNAKLAERMSLLLRKEKFITKAVNRLSEAIRHIQQEHVSVLILDVEVKDMAWDEAVPIIKGLDPSLPIIITAAHNTPELEANILRQKVFYYHVKSFGTDELILAIRNAIKNDRDF